MEWHVTPEYINENWTEELLTLMFMKRKVRIDKLLAATKRSVGAAPVEYEPLAVPRRMSDTDFIAKHAASYRRIDAGANRRD